LTNEACSPNHTCWTYDTWALSHGTAQELLSEGADSWYFLTPNYAFGKSLYEEASKVVLANKGKVLGNSVYPFPETSDFSSFLLQAQASKAKILAMAGGNTDASNMLKQAAEFQIGAPGSGQLIAALIFLILDVHAAGLEISQGLNLMESFYWDMNDGTRALTKRYAAHMSGSVPCMMQAGMYSGVLHYLKTAHAMGVDKAKASGRAVVNQMIAMPTQDIVYAKGALRRDGRHIHDMYIFQVKTPAESKYPWDYFKLVKTIPAEKAFRPLSEGTCNLVKT
jgi:branched-chain amino acid transport system substrate-binding protein